MITSKISRCEGGDWRADVFRDGEYIDGARAERMAELHDWLEESYPQRNKPVWQCEDCGRIVQDDPGAGDDWGGVEEAVGPTCADCSCEMVMIKSRQ